MGVPGWSAFLGRANRTWAGLLEPLEIRNIAMAYAWVVPAIPLLLAALVAGLVMQLAGVSMAGSVIPWAVATLYSLLALLMWRLRNREARRLVARRLGIDTKAARTIDFRGYEKFERSLARARGASGSR